MLKSELAANDLVRTIAPANPLDYGAGVVDPVPVGSVGVVTTLNKHGEYASVGFENGTSQNWPVSQLLGLGNGTGKFKNKAIPHFKRYAVYFIETHFPHSVEQIINFKRLEVVATEEEANEVCLFPYEYGYGEDENRFVVTDIPAGKKAPEFLFPKKLAPFKVYYPRLSTEGEREVFNASQWLKDNETFLQIAA